MVPILIAGVLVILRGQVLVKGPDQAVADLLAKVKLEVWYFSFIFF